MSGEWRGIKASCMKISLGITGERCVYPVSYPTGQYSCPTGRIVWRFQIPSSTMTRPTTTLRENHTVCWSGANRRKEVNGDLLCVDQKYFQRRAAGCSTVPTSTAPGECNTGSREDSELMYHTLCCCRQRWMLEVLGFSSNSQRKMLKSADCRES